MFAMETHVTYQAELYEGELLRVETQLLGVDAKRVHHFHRMLRARDGALAATCEWMSLHVSLTERRSCPIPDDLATRLAAMLEAHASLPDPPEKGRVMGFGTRGE
jgi:acyl-CoA thioester hydrolase